MTAWLAALVALSSLFALAIIRMKVWTPPPPPTPLQLALRQLAVQIDGVKVAIGTALLPAFQRLATSLSAFAETTRKGSP